MPSATNRGDGPGFTKGPWFVQQEQNPTTPSSGRSETLAVHDAHGERIALPSNLADARLIAAAPGLYASISETHAWVRRIQDVMTGYLVPDGYDAEEALNKLIEMLDGPEQREIQGRAFAALSLARGEVTHEPRGQQ